MELNNLLQFIALEDKRLRERYGNSGDNEKLVLARTVKMSEEMGELCNEVLIHCALQRKEKLDAADLDNLSAEFADVLITTLLLANSMSVDIKSALEHKIAKINARYIQP
ncbi:MAG: MazG-like family protein [Patescibacteria group bacterium]|jgi:NTP pyrophosphatase (non-canonical NTP hydrolase)